MLNVEVDLVVCVVILDSQMLDPAGLPPHPHMQQQRSPNGYNHPGAATMPRQQGVNSSGALPSHPQQNDKVPTLFMCLRDAFVCLCCLTPLLGMVCVLYNFLCSPGL